jgi:cell division protease FtsH
VTALLAGQVAEQLVFNEKTTGAGNDLQRVTQIARAMVCEYGMSDKLGTMALGRRSHNPFLGRDYAMDERNYSEDVAKLIDEEVRAIVEHCRSRCQEILSTNRAKLDQIVQALLEHETLDREQFLAVMAGTVVPTRVQEPDFVNQEPAEDREEERTPQVSPPPRFEPGPA